MSNYLFYLVAKSLNLIDTVQPLTLSVFEPLPEPTLDWEQSFTTSSTESETTSQTDNFPNSEIVQSSKWRSPAEEIANPFFTNLTSTPAQSFCQVPKSTSDLAQKPKLELSQNLPFIDPVMSQIPINNSLLTSNTELKTNTTLSIPALTQLSQKQPTAINTKMQSQVIPVTSNEKKLEIDAPVVPHKVALSFDEQLLQLNTTSYNSFIFSNQSTNLVILEELSHQSKSKSQVIPKFLQPGIMKLTESFLSNYYITLPETQSKESFLKPTYQQINTFRKIPIEINQINLSLPLDLNTDLLVSANVNPLKTVTSSSIDQEKILLQPNIKTTITTAIARANNAPVSRFIDTQSPEIITQSLNNQLIGINRVDSFHSLLMGLSLKQSLRQLQAETNNILSRPSVIQKKSAIENLDKQPTENHLVFTHYLPLQADSFEALLPQLKSEVKGVASLRDTMQTVSSTNASVVNQLSPLTSALAMETSNPDSSFVTPQPEKSVTELSSTPSLQIQANVPSAQVQELMNSQVLFSQIPQPTAIPLVSSTNTSVVNQLSPLTSALTMETSNPDSSFVTPQPEKSVTELSSTPSLQIQANVPSAQVQELMNSQVLFSQIPQPTAIPLVASANTSVVNQLSPLTSALTMETSNPDSSSVTPQPEKSVTELSSTPSLQIQANVPSAQVQELMNSQVLFSQIPQPTAIPLVGSANTFVVNQLSPLTSALAMETSNSVIQPQIAPVAIASIYDQSLSHLHKQTLIPTIAPKINIITPQSTIELQEKFTSDVPEIQQSIFPKNVSSVQPLLTDTSTKIPSLQTNISTASSIDKLPLAVTSPTTQLTTINSDILPTPALQKSTARTNTLLQVDSYESHLSNFREHETSTHKVVPQINNTKYYNNNTRQKIGVVEQSNKKLHPQGDGFFEYGEEITNTPRPMPNAGGWLPFSTDKKMEFPAAFNELGQAGGEMKVSYNHHPKINLNENILTSPTENLILPQNASGDISMSADRGKDKVRSSYFRQLEESDIKPLSEPINDLSVKNLSVIAARNKKVQKRSPVGVDTPPAIKVTIDRLEIRSPAPAPPPPRPKPRPAPSVMSLNEYLQRRARRG